LPLAPGRQVSPDTIISDGAFASIVSATASQLAVSTCRDRRG
jgi:hypothetical protein